MIRKYVIHVSLPHVIQSEISQERSKKMNQLKKSYQHILRYLYSETIKHRGEISLHKHFKDAVQSVLRIASAQNEGRIETLVYIHLRA